MNTNDPRGIPGNALVSPRAVLFDFDGTLANTYPGIAASINHIRARYGLPALPEDEVRWNVGRGPAYLLQRTVPVGDNAANVEAYKQHQLEVIHDGTRLFPDTLSTLQALHNLGLKLAICSNKPKMLTLDLLRYFQLASFFAAVVGPEDVARPKPAPDMLHHGLNALDLTANQALYVGDMVVDIETARGAGVRVWVVPTGSEERAALHAGRPDRLLENLADLADLLGPRHGGAFA
ncbi:MAG: HAD family hydrolase [Planctomycetia bacterium]|nr:HAD family hydrolase [Planctomycetia bacterium]